LKRLFGIVAAVFALATASCAAVPTLDFGDAGVGGDATAGDGSAIDDGGFDGDAQPSEAGDGAMPTCPTGFSCCPGTTHACVNTQGTKCNPNECTLCNCAADAYCCASGNTVVCHALDASCP
jgi:hypothetical protein